MLERRLTAWLRPVLTLLAAGAILSLAACGGGSGAPNNPYAPAPAPITPVVVVPATGTAYAGVPYTLTISGGVAPYTAVSSNPAVLPVSQSVSGTNIVVIAANVASDTTATIDVQDSTTQRATVTVVVKPALLLPAAVTITGSPACTSGPQLCSGTTGTARVTVTAPGGGGIPNRQVRFDVVQGTYAILSNNPAQPLVQTLTVVTDQNGDAIVGLSVPANTVSQLGVIRATEVTSGMQITGQFTIVQQITGTNIVSTIPNGKTTINGPYKGACSIGVRVTHYVFGGTPPYRISTNFPDAVTIVGNPVLTQGGSFDTITNGACFVGLTYAIVDANGLTVSTPPTVDNVEGTTDAPTTPVGTLTVSPSAQTPSSCTNGGGQSFTITGGTSPYSVTSSNTSAIISPQPVANSGDQFRVSGLVNGSGVTTLTIVDSSRPQKTTTATISCPTPTAAPFTVQPSGYSGVDPATCPGKTFTFAVTGGTPPYTTYASVPLPPGSTISPTTLPAAGSGFAVTIAPTASTNPIVYYVGVRDSSTPTAQVSIVSVGCGY